MSVFDMKGHQAPWRRDNRPAADRFALALDLGLFIALLLFTTLHADRINAISASTAILARLAFSQAWHLHDARDDIAEAVTRLLVVSLASLLLSTMIVGGLATFMPALTAKLMSLPAIWFWQRSIVVRRATKRTA